MSPFQALPAAVAGTVGLGNIAGVAVAIGGAGTTLWMILAGEAHGVALTSADFGSALSWFPCVLVLCVVLFASTTMITWSYYGLQAWTCLLGDSAASTLAFTFILLAFGVVGASMGLGPVIDFSDSMIFAMSLGSSVGMYLLMPEVRAELLRCEQGMRSGGIRMVIA